MSSAYTASDAIYEIGTSSDDIGEFLVSAKDSIDEYKAPDIGKITIDCYKQLEHLFERYEKINLKVLIGYWMKAGFLGPVHSAEQVYGKGHAMLLELINLGFLKYSDEDREVIELVRSTDSNPIRCRHLGFCATEELGLVDFVDFDKIGEVELTDGIPKKKEKKKGSVDRVNGKYPSKNKELRYVANSNPRPDSLKPLLENIKEPSVLLLRGCEWVLQEEIHIKNFKTLSVLEISGLSHLDYSLLKAISKLHRLRSLNLSNLPIQTLELHFSGLTQLRRLTLRGFSYVPDFPLRTISVTCRLKCLNLSLPIETLPDDFFFKLEELQWVILRGCSKLISLPSIKPLKKLKMLDLSHCSALLKLAPAVLANFPIQMLDISYTALKYIPTIKGTPCLTHLFVRNPKVAALSSLKQISSLEVLDLSGAENVKEIKQLVGNKNLIVLDLSRTKITSIDFLSSLFDLRNLILQECTRLTKIPEMKHLTKLEVLDMSNCKSLSDLPEDLSNLRNLKELDLFGCSSLEGLREGVFDQMTCLEKLDLSKTRVNRLPSFANLVNLCKLSLRGLQLDSLETLASLSHLVELDLTGLQISSSQELNLDFLKFLQNLLILNISHTSVVTLPDISKIVNLKVLLLESCQHLKILSHLHTLTNMETLDLSLPQDNTANSVQEDIQSEAQTIQFLSAPSNLRKLLLANRPGVLKLFPLTSLSNLVYLDIRGTDEIDFVRAHSSKMENIEEVVGWDSSTTHRETAQGRTSKLDELHVVSTFYQSGFDRFKTNFRKIERLISSIHIELESASPDTIVKAEIKNQAFKRHFGSMLTDLQFLVRNIHLLESAHNPKRSDELLHELVDAATHPSAYDFSLDSTNLNLLLRLVLKLKLLVPTKQVDDLEAYEVAKKEKKLHFVRRKNKETVVTDNVEAPQGMADLLSSYEYLNGTERKCLLCFSVFPFSEGRHENTGVLKSKSLVIKKRMLIHGWVGEGFIGSPESISSQNLSFDPRVNSNSNQEMSSKTETSAARYETNQVSTIETLKKSKRTEEIGIDILRALEENRFMGRIQIDHGGGGRAKRANE